MPLLHIDRALGDNVYPTWENWYRQAGRERADLAAGSHVGLSVMAIQGAVAGDGAVLATDLLVADAAAKGRLIPVGGPAPDIRLIRHALRPEAPRTNPRRRVQATVRLLDRLVTLAAAAGDGYNAAL